jgi:hypothetical protein
VTATAHRRFGGTYRLHLKGQSVSQANSKIGLILGPEDEGNIFLRNVDNRNTSNPTIKLVTYRICYSAMVNCNDNSVTGSVTWCGNEDITRRHAMSKPPSSNCQTPLARLMTLFRKTPCCCPCSILLLEITVAIAGDWWSPTPIVSSPHWSSSARFYSKQAQHNTPHKSYTANSLLVWAVTP